MASEIKTVSLASARDWLAGVIDDDALTAGNDLIYWRELPALADYRASLAEIVRLNRAGVPAMIARACHPAVTRKLRREGCLLALQEWRNYGGGVILAGRWLAPAEQLKRWIDKFLNEHAGKN